MKVALYVRVSTSDKGQTVENQLLDLNEVAARMKWDVVAVFSDHVSGAKGREKRPGFDALLKGVTRREFDLVAAWSVDRLSRSLSDLVGFLNELQARNVGVYLHTQGFDTTTPAGRAMVSMCGIFAELERAILRERIMAGLRRSTKKAGRPAMAPAKMEAIRHALQAGSGVRETARKLRTSATTVSRIKRSLSQPESGVAEHVIPTELEGDRVPV